MTLLANICIANIYSRLSLAYAVDRATYYVLMCVAHNSGQKDAQSHVALDTDAHPAQPPSPSLFRIPFSSVKQKCWAKRKWRKANDSCNCHCSLCAECLQSVGSRFFILTFICNVSVKCVSNRLLHATDCNSNVINRWIYARCKFNYIKIFPCVASLRAIAGIFVYGVVGHYNRFNAMHTVRGTYPWSNASVFPMMRCCVLYFARAKCYTWQCTASHIHMGNGGRYTFVIFPVNFPLLFIAYNFVCIELCDGMH